MIRPITLMTAQWQDLSFAELCALAEQMGFDGIEIAAGPHFDPIRAAADTGYCDELLSILDAHHLGVWALSAHDAGHCVTSTWDPRIRRLARMEDAPLHDVQRWAAETMLAFPQAARNMGVSIVTGFMGSPIWPIWYEYPPTEPHEVSEGFAETEKLWRPILDRFAEHEVRFAFEVHPTQIAFDYYTAERLMDMFSDTRVLGINLDPSHLEWQGVSSVVFIRDFAQRIFHVHVKDVAVTLDGRAGLLGSHLPAGNTRRGWNFRAPGHGDIDFESILRELNAIDYDGPLSVEWEDAAMDRVRGAAQACAFVQELTFDIPRPDIRM